MPNSSNTRLSVPFSQILGEADRIIPHYTQYEAEFAARKPKKFTAEFKAKLLANVAKAHSSPDDDAMRAAHHTETQLLIDTAAKFGPLEVSLQDYLDEIPISGEMIKAEFGAGHLGEIKKSPRKILRHLEGLPALFTKYSAELSAIGLPDSLVSDFEALRNELSEQVAAQAAAIDDRHSATPERMALINSIMDDLSSIESTAEVIYSNRPSIAMLFVVDRANHVRHARLTPAPATASTNPTT